MRAPASERPLIVGPESGPEPPFPLRLSGPVIKGFGRGSKELQIPTANIPISGLSVGGCDNVDSGVYFGFASLDLPTSTTTAEEELKAGNIFPMVMSIGWNPFYKNEVRSVEVHIVHDFSDDFYDVEMRLCILGWIRPEFDYVSKEALIDDIRMDIRVGVKSLKRPAYSRFLHDPYLLEFGKEGENGVEKL
ncbi:riboflavin kinase [Wilcoxina mikolae CBS 423.85]|nr:riboflavin kinase [Wilcoxina mikolae CBS 423.85]